MFPRFLTAGESHGPSLVTIVEGIPAGVPLKAEQINQQLSRRQKGYGRGGRMKIEQDRVEILSGVRAGKTLGSPITLKVENKDWKNWQAIMDVAQDEIGQKKVVHHPRPGHADLAGGIKYDHEDLRNVLERASARETAARVAAGAVARIFLEEFGIQIVGHLVNLGGISVPPSTLSLTDLAKISEGSPLRCVDPAAEKRMIKKIDEAKKSGDSLGGIFEIIVAGLPVGLGSHVQWDRKLDGRLAQALMSIQAIKGVEVGMGFEAALRFGSQVHDEIFYNRKKKFYRETNHAGGLEGGMTNGENLVLRAAMKPIATLMHPLRSVNIKTKKPYEAVIERSDVTAAPAAAVVGENVVAWTLLESFLEKFGGDSLKETKRNVEGYQNQVDRF